MRIEIRDGELADYREDDGANSLCALIAAFLAARRTSIAGSNYDCNQMGSSNDSPSRPKTDCLYLRGVAEIPVRWRLRGVGHVT